MKTTRLLVLIKIILFIIIFKPQLVIITIWLKTNELLIESERRQHFAKR